MSLIKNWGFQWQRQYIFRGAGSNAGHLKGYASGLAEADFREQIGVYILHDRDLRIVYVGQAGNGNATLFNRLKNHLDGRLAGRWDYFTWFGFLKVNIDGTLSDVADVKSRVSGFTYSEALDQVEGILIETIEPSLNKQAGQLKDAREYTQLIDPKMREISNAELLEKIEILQHKIEAKLT
jgi:hypothetical protein